MSGEEKREREVVFSAEFDDFNDEPNHKPGVVDVSIEPCRSMSVGLSDHDGMRHQLVSVFRDQWGAWVTIFGVNSEEKPAFSVTAQEDQTRSFLDAMIRALKVLRYYNEFGTKPADVVVGADEEKKADSQFQNRGE